MTSGGYARAPDRDAVFEAQLEAALDLEEIKKSLTAEGAPTSDTLRYAANAQRLRLLDLAARAEGQYVLLMSRSSDAPDGPLGKTVLRWALVVTAALPVLSGPALYGWVRETNAAVGRERSVGNAVQNAVILFALLVAAAVIGFVIVRLLFARLGGGLLSVSRRILPEIETATAADLPYVREASRRAAMRGARQSAVAIVLLGGGLMLWLGLAGQPGNPGAPLLALVIAAVILALLIALYSPGVQDWWLALTSPSWAAAERVRLAQTKESWEETLRLGLLSFLRSEIDSFVKRRMATTLAISQAPGLRRARGIAFHVPTPAETELVGAANGMDGGSIALAGPRGVGKSDLLEAFCAGTCMELQTLVGLGIMVRAPVLYQRQEFMLHLFTRVCEDVCARGPDSLKGNATAHLQWIRFLQTRKDEKSASMTWRGLGVGAKRETSFARQPYTYPEIVQALVGFLTEIADVLRENGRRLVIGIDELDRIQPAEHARDFLNELRALFDIPENCIFVLSVSDEALRDADLTPAGRRDVFDSAIDEVVRVDPLDQATAVRLLGTRVIGLPEPFAALFNCLSGGVPRDLLRIARAAVGHVGPGLECSLDDIAQTLVKRELARIRSSAQSGPEPNDGLLQLFDGDLSIAYGRLHALGEQIIKAASGTGLGTTLANRAFNLDTTLGIFQAKGFEDRLTRARSALPDPFTVHARATRLIGVADGPARTTLVKIRRAWGLADLPDGA